MHEVGRGGGGTLVAATIAALHNRASAHTERRAIRKRVSPVESRNSLRGKRDDEEVGMSRSKRGDSAGAGGADRPRSTASETSERDSASVQSGEGPSERDAGRHASRDSDSPDGDTLECTLWDDSSVVVSGAVGAVDLESDSTSSSDADDTSGEGDGGGGRFSSAPQVIDSEYRTLTPSGRRDTSTRCDGDFRWLRSGETTPGPERSWGERQQRRSRERGEDFGSGSLDRRRRKGPDRGDRDRKTRSSVGSKPPQHPATSGASARRARGPELPLRIEGNPRELQRRWNSYELFRWPENASGGVGRGGSSAGWWPMCWCHAPPPPCCRDHASVPSPWISYPAHLTGDGSSRAPCKNEAEERARRLEADKGSLQLQVQVLSQQIAAQADKIADLERALGDAQLRANRAQDALQKEVLARSALETQKLELLSKLSEATLRVAERSVQPERARPAPPRTPPANYGRQIERNTHAYSSLPRAAHAPDARVVAFGKNNNNMVVARGRGHSVPNLAEKEEVIPPRGSPSPSLRGGGSSPWAKLTRVGSSGASTGGAWLEGGDLTRGGVRATAMPRMQRDHQTYPWQTIDVNEWDVETTCSWLETLSLETYCVAARSWLGASPDVRGLMASSTPITIEKELGLKHPMHRKKIVLALLDLQGGDGDSYLGAAGRLDAAWVQRWMEDAGLAGVRDAAAEGALDGRCLHRLTHEELHHHLRVNTLLHALSVRRGIQVLRENEFSADTMVRRGAESAEGGAAQEVRAAELARWSSHRVMQWLKEIDLAEYAPNLRGAGVHGGLMLYEHRFTAELLATMLNIPASKTLLRRHLTQRFNDLLGREVIQQKRTAEQTLGYQPLTITSKYKVPKKSQFSLKRRKSRDELDLGELVCPLSHTEDCSDDELKRSSRSRVGCLSPA